MAIKNTPKNEAQFIAELREGLNKSFPKRFKMHRTNQPGQPDHCMEFLDADGLVMYTCYAEFKYSKHPGGSLEKYWNFLREIQKVTMLNMAASGLNVYLIVCEAGIEAPWFIFNKAQAKKAILGECKKFTVLSQMFLSKRWPNGKWTSGQDWGELEEDTMPAPTLGDIVKRNGLVRPSLGLIKPHGY